MLARVKIKLAESYELSLGQLKDCLKLFDPDLEGVDCVVFMYNLREEKCLKAYKMQKPCDLVETFAELYLNRSDIKDKGKIDEIILSAKKVLWEKADRLEEEITYLERLQGIDGEPGIIARGAIEELTMELDQIDEKIMELDALLELFKSKLKETDKYLIIEQDKLKGLVFMDRYVLIIINVEKLEEIIKRQIKETELNEIKQKIAELT